MPLLIRQLGASGGLMVSASHNPPQDNGIKVFGADGAKLDAQHQALIEQGFAAIWTPPEPLISAVVHRFSAMICCRFIATASSPPSATTALMASPSFWICAGGPPQPAEREVFQALGADLTVLHGEPDGQRINVDCGSTQLEPLRQAVVERGAAMGFAFDGDADRMLAVDGRGRVVDGDHVLFLWGSVPQERQALPDQRLVATVMSNLGFERAGSGVAACLSAPRSETSTCTLRWCRAERPSVASNPVTSLPRPMASAETACSRRCNWPPFATTRESP